MYVVMDRVEQAQTLADAERRCRVLSATLKPCPFCGGAATVGSCSIDFLHVGHWHKLRFWVQHWDDQCPIRLEPDKTRGGMETGYFDIPEDAVSQWNGRA